MHALGTRGLTLETVAVFHCSQKVANTNPGDLAAEATCLCEAGGAGGTRLAACFFVLEPTMAITSTKQQTRTMKTTPPFQFKGLFVITIVEIWNGSFTRL